MLITKKIDTYPQRGDWAPDAVLAPPPGYQPTQPSDTVSFFGVELPAAQLIPAPEHRPVPTQEPRVWAPDAVLMAPPGYTSEPAENKGTVSFFGAEIPPQLLFPQTEQPVSPPEPKVWAPDAILAPPPGYAGEPEPAQVSYFGVKLPYHQGFVD